MRPRFLLVALLVASLPGAVLAEGDPQKGENVFKKCRACHTTEEGVNKIGPSLHGVVGRQVASVESYGKYSDAMKAKAAEGMVWTEENLDAYLADPKGFIPGNKMVFPGLKKPDERANVIAFLKSQGE